MDFTFSDQQQQIRETAWRLCENFGPDYWLERDDTGEFPEDFYQALAKDGWLESEQHGRRSYYQLTSDGRERFRAATHRIYGEPRPDWDGQWCLLLVSALDAGERESLGVGAIAARVSREGLEVHLHR